MSEQDEQGPHGPLRQLWSSTFMAEADTPVWKKREDWIAWARKLNPT